MMGEDRGPGDQTREQRPASTDDTDRRLEAVLDRIGGVCRILAEEIVLFDYLNERKLRHALDQQDLEF